MTRSIGARAARFIASFAIALLVLYAVFLGGGWIGIYDVGLRLVSLACIAGVLAAWGVAAAFRPAFRPRSAIWPALVVPLAALALSTALSRSPRIGVEYLCWSVLLVALYLLLQRLLADDHFRPRLMDLAVALCAALGVIYLAACLVEWLRWWELVGHLAVPPLRPGFARLTFGNPSAVMTIQVLLWSSAVARIGLTTRARRAAVGMLTLLTIAVTVVSGSRAGWLGLGVAVIVLAAAWLLVERNRAALRRRAGSRAAAATLAVGAIGVGAAIVLLAPAVLSRLLVGGEAVRASYFAAAWRMALDSPVVGSGAGMWVAQRIAYTPAPETDYYIPHAHDIYLQTLAESGLVGLAAGVVAVACLLWLIIRAIRSDDQVRRSFGWCALFATTYFGAHQILDFYPNMPAALIAFAIPIAWLDAASDRPIVTRPSSVLVRRLAALTLAVATVVAIGALGWTESSGRSQDAAVKAANAGDWAAALGPATTAADQDPGMPADLFVLGLAAARAGDTATAESALASVAASDDLPVAWLDLAAVEVERGEMDAARASLDRALRLGDQQAAIALGAGDLYLRMGDRAPALRAFATAVRRAPSLAGDPWWTSADGIPADWPQVLDDAIAMASPEGGADAALSSGDAPRARTIAATIADPRRRQLYLTAIDAWSGDEAAFVDLQDRASSTPLDIPTIAWAARVSARRGDQENADRYRAWLGAVNDGASAAGHEVRIGGPGSVFSRPAEPAGIGSIFWGTYTYRRPTPWDQLVPVLPHLVYR